MTNEAPTADMLSSDRSAAFSVAAGGRLRCWAREPLLHFLAAGLLLFGGYAILGSGAPAEGRDIRVDEESLLQFVQFRAKVFSESKARAHLRALDGAARARLIEEYVREEALHREALAWGLDQNDYVIRRRLVQSLEFAASSADAPGAPVEDAALRRHYEANKASYAAAPTLSFTHIFFSADRHGQSEARRLAHQALSTKAGNISAAGDRFLYHRNYVDHRPDLIASHFSPAMAEKLFALDADPDRWQGPFESPHGVHLVRITERRAGGIPRFDEVADIVAHDVREARAEAGRQRILDAIIARYRVDVDADLRGEQ